MSRLQYWLKVSHLLLRYLVFMHQRSYTRPLWTNNEFTLQLLVQKQQWIPLKYVQYCVRINMDRWTDLICPIRCSLHIYVTKNVYVIKTKEDPNLLACYTMFTWCNILEDLSFQQQCCENLKSYEIKSPPESETLALEICDQILLTLLFWGI